MNDFITITGLWESTDKNGNKYMSANCNKVARWFVVKNQFKKSEKEPDYFLKIAKIQEKKEDTQPKQKSLEFEEAPF